MGGTRRARPLDLLPLHLRPRRLTRAQTITAGIAARDGADRAGRAAGARASASSATSAASTPRSAGVDPEVKSVERVVRELERKRKLVATVTGIEAAAMRPLPVLRELTDLLPTDAWLTTLSFDQKGVELTGQAAAASALIPLLENSPRLERVEFASPVTRGRDKEQFRIRAAWEVAPVAAAATPPPPTRRLSRARDAARADPDRARGASGRRPAPAAAGRAGARAAHPARRHRCWRQPACRRPADPAGPAARASAVRAAQPGSRPRAHRDGSRRPGQERASDRLAVAPRAALRRPRRGRARRRAGLDLHRAAADRSATGSPPRSCPAGSRS